MQNTKRLINAAFLLTVLIILSGCTSLKLAEIVISPLSSPIICKQESVFYATGYDKSKNIAPLEDDLAWSVSPDDGVIVTDDAASQRATFTFPEAGTYTITAISGHIVEEKTVEVVCATLSRIQVLPLALDLMEDETRELTVTGYDQFDNPMPITGTISWFVTGGIGEVDPTTGLTTTFTAQSVGGGTVRAEVGLISDSSAVNVKAAPTLTTILISPQFATTWVGKSVSLLATPYDQYGHVIVTGCTPTWSVVGGVGYVTPINRMSTTFYATTVGSGELVVTCGSVTGRLAFNVLPST